MIDVITYEEISDPVVLSSGHVFDRSSVLTPQGKLKIDRCPVTREDLLPKVYPQVKLKSKINRMQIGRLNQLIFIANSFKHDESKFNAALERAEKILSQVKEDVYKAEASKVAKLMLNSP